MLSFDAKNDQKRDSPAIALIWVRGGLRGAWARISAFETFPFIQGRLTSKENPPKNSVWADATGEHVPIETIHTYLVHPAKGGENNGTLHGSQVNLDGKLFGLLNDIYGRSDTECTIDISFNQGSDGSQSNPCRALILAHIGAATIETGRSLAQRLAGVTTKRSGMGLVFLLLGSEGAHRKLVVSRFPAHSAILAETNQAALSVEFLERVFMRSAFSYKAALYRDASVTTGFWVGRAVDKQIRTPDKETSDYWIKEFLDSDFRTTPARGTRRLAEAMKEAARKSGDLSVKSQIASAVTLAGGLDGQNTSVNEFMDQFGLSQTTRDAILKEFRDPNIPAENFTFSASVFTEQVPYRSVELDSGAILTAPSPDFEEVFTTEPVDGEVRYSTTGTVVSERLAKTKR